MLCNIHFQKYDRYKILTTTLAQGLEGVSRDPWIDRKTERESGKLMKNSRDLWIIYSLWRVII